MRRCFRKFLKEGQTQPVRKATQSKTWAQQDGNSCEGNNDLGKTVCFLLGIQKLRPGSQPAPIQRWGWLCLSGVWLFLPGLEYGPSEVLHGSPLLRACSHLPMTSTPVLTVLKTLAAAYAGNGPSSPKEQ